MASQHGSIGKNWPSAGALLALAVLALIALPALVALGWSSPGMGSTSASFLWRAASFTLLQAVLSTLISVVLGVLLARALSRRQFFGREFLLRLFTLPQGLPALVAVLALVSLYGRAGFISRFWPELPSIYGLNGILLAHVFFNLPYAALLTLIALQQVPREQWRLAQMLGMSERAIFRVIEWPVLQNALPGIAGLIFMLCVTSFTIVLTLGGGPAATTLELAIYQALRFDYDPGLALALAMGQIGLCALLLSFLAKFRPPFAETARLSLGPERASLSKSGNPVPDMIIIVLSALFILLPILSVILSGLTADFSRLLTERILWRAIATSGGIAFTAALIAVLIAYPLALAAIRLESKGAVKKARIFEAPVELTLLLPPVLLGAGWFLILMPSASSVGYAPVLIVLINAIMALPFVYRSLAVSLRRLVAHEDPLCESLGIAGWSRFSLIDWPILKPAFRAAFTFAFLLSFGDFGVIAFFGSDSIVTLPFLIYQRLGSYRTDDAAGIALVLAVFSILMTQAFSAFGRKEHAHD